MGKLCSSLVAVCFSLTTAQSSHADDLEALGDVLQIAVPAYSLYASYDLNGRDGLRSCAQAIGATALTTHALKYAIDAPRPNGSGRGFPSGHTSSAAVGFGCMLGQEGWSTTTMILGASTLLTGYSRVESDHHDWEQVGAGLLLGTAIGYFSTRHLNEGQSIEYGFAPDGEQSLSFRMEF
jgi:membrane-associated phospholipid phosphatase